ncbi:bifunctional DNA primase/polymerase, partial [Nonomuraea sp. B19D2]|uniref:bifunctional DNA primase/polymerase n=1 Tax=Nonomuraea sp. B19D2 TaxID=3159561 RepID=UPI0032D9CD1F
MNDPTRYALAAAARGWHVFPLVPGGKVPPRGFTHWEDRATADPDTIRAWWERTPYNVGIATGPSRLVVIDLDTPKEGQSPPAEWDRPGVAEGADVLAALCGDAGQPLPLETFQVRTRRGGMHLYYTAPEGTTLANTTGAKGGLGWLIDTRVLPGAENADEAGTDGADDRRREHPAAGVCDGVFIGKVSSFVG